MPVKVSYIKEVLRSEGIANRPQAGAICRMSVCDLSFDPETNVCPTFTSLFSLDEGGEKNTGSLEICAGESVIEQALYTCLMTMGPGDVCRLEIPSTGSNLEGNEGGGQVCCVLELLSIIDPLPVFKLSDPEKLALAIKEKQLGVVLAGQGVTQTSAECFQRALRMLIAMESEDEADTSALRCALYNNLSQHQLHNDRPAYAAELADRVLLREPNNAKALWRRALAAQALGDADAARTHIEQLLRVQPNNASAAARLRELSADNRAKDDGMAAMARAMLGL